MADDDRDVLTPYHALYAYTMARPRFILQHVVDAQLAQTADEHTKPIGVVFALVGLYLHVEQGFTGHQVQQVHRALAAEKRTWPVVALPSERGRVTPDDVMQAPAGPERDAAIDIWCASVWAAYHQWRATIKALLREHAIR